MTAVLLVDDSLLAMKVLSTAISQLLPECEMITAASGDAALEVLAGLDGKPLDLAILDYNMPGMSGLDLAKKIASCRPGIPMVLSTANVQNSVARRAHAGGIPMIDKPMSVEKLREVFQSLGLNK